MAEATSGAQTRLRRLILNAAGRPGPANVALMHLLIEAGHEARLGPALAKAAAELDRTAPASPEAARIGEMRGLLDRMPGAPSRVDLVMREADHRGAAARAGDDAVAHWAGVFDRLARAEPEAGVALYALGSPEILAAATEEVVAALGNWGLLGPDRRVLEIGCGIGRFAPGLAARCAGYVGTDVSGEMIAQARRRAVGLAAARFEWTDGRGLSGFAASSFDLVLAADVFPYLVAAADGLADHHVREAARVLRPGGSLLILNYSYRGDPECDRADLEGAALSAGLVPRPALRAAFLHWDAAAFCLDRPEA